MYVEIFENEPDYSQAVDELADVEGGLFVDGVPEWVIVRLANSFGIDVVDRDENEIWEEIVEAEKGNGRGLLTGRFGAVRCEEDEQTLFVLPFYDYLSLDEMRRIVDLAARLDVDFMVTEPVTWRAHTWLWVHFHARQIDEDDQL